ncbi:hypothetical protein SQW15_18985 [Pseudomonas asiatica]|uniref:hypothetical protein n=1 Tax=Pseudomonas asiatica TaxID=2219225 RepID=UPI0010C096AE|nr:hypothetical protein [Pseudomonas asiatica]MBO2921323.1 hypothetical protein [Pseudomonas asiatica]WPU58780.1 hypothetical protein SQW15_18985 [Pseudomonas asiatica]
MAMDVDFFLKERTAFIKYYYDEAIAPFVETMRKIEAEEAPYVPPLFDPETMSDEPAFLVEWLRAETAFQLVGQTCVSMLSETLKIFFMTHEDLSGFDMKACGKGAFKNGFIQGYQAGFAHYGVDWSQCPVDFDILEQVVLARNSTQHGNHITSTRISHKRDDLKKHSSPVFVSAHEKEMMEQWGGSWLIEPAIHVTRDALHQAVGEVEKLAEWMSTIDFRALLRAHRTAP